MLSEEIDFAAWGYAIERLPAHIFETYIYVLINKAPKLMASDEKLSSELMPKVKTTNRLRDVYQFLEGKNVVLCREMETDVLDFVSNLCIHVVESSKLRRLLNSPVIISKLY